MKGEQSCSVMQLEIDGCFALLDDLQAVVDKSCDPRFPIYFPQRNGESSTLRPRELAPLKVKTVS